MTAYAEERAAHDARTRSRQPGPYGDMPSTDAPPASRTRDGGPANDTGPTATDPLRGLGALARVALLGRERILEQARKPVPYVWQDIAVDGTIATLAGPSGEGKTTLLFLLAVARMHIGEPVSLLTRKVTPAAPGRFFVLIEGEHGETSTSRKLERSCALLGIPDACLDRVIIVARKAVRLGAPEWLDVVRLIRAGLVSDIAIDTIARVAPVDGNSEQEQVEVFDTIASALDAAPSPETKPIAWVVAHLRKNGNGNLEDVSGSAQRVGQSDTVLMVRAERNEKGQVVSSTVRFAKLREDPDEYPAPVTFAIVDEDGRKVLRTLGDTSKTDAPLDALIVLQLELGPKAAGTLAKALGRSYKDVQSALSDLFARRPCPITGTDTTGRNGKPCRVFSLTETSRRRADDVPSTEGADDAQTTADDAAQCETQ